VDKRATFN